MIACLPRINELANKSKKTGLSAEEKAEQRQLREEYLQAVRGACDATLLQTTVKDPLGNDVTPDKLKEAQGVTKLYH